MSNALSLLGRRAIIMGQAQGGGRILPAGYTAYDWVQCNTTDNGSSILVDLYPNRDNAWMFEGRFARTGDMPSDYNHYSIFTRSSTAGYHSNYGLIRKAQNNKGLVFNFNTRCNCESYAGVASTSIEIGEWHTFELKTNGSTYGGQCVLDGGAPVEYSQSGNPTYDATKELRLINGYPCRLARFKVYYQEELVADLVPAMRDADSTAGFYDVVRATFYAPTGDSTYTCGNGFEDFTV